MPIENKIEPIQEELFQEAQYLWLDIYFYQLDCGWRYLMWRYGIKLGKSKIFWLGKDDHLLSSFGIVTFITLRS